MSALNWQRANADARMRRNGVETLGGSRSGRRLPPSKTPRSIPRAPKLAAPVVIAEFWVNRGGESLRIQLRAFAGRALFDARKYFTAADGTLQPSRKGFAIDICKLPLLATAINKALARAIELGLLAADEASNG